MRLTVIGVLIALIGCWSNQGASQEADPALWLLNPIVGPLGECAGYGTDMRKNVQSLVAELKIDTKEVVPVSAWKMMEQVIFAPDWASKTKATSEQILNCKKVIQAYKNGGFLGMLRASLTASALGEMGGFAIRCIAKHPDMESNFKVGWASAMKRDKFSLTLERIKSISDANPVNRDDSRLNILECKKGLDLLNSSDFDAMFSNKTISELFMSPNEHSIRTASPCTTDCVFIEPPHSAAADQPTPATHSPML